MYKAQAEQQQGAPGAGEQTDAAGGSGQEGEDVQDVDFEEVK